MSGATPADVFVSYSSRDRERVVAIADRIAASGVSVWIDRRRIDGGANYGVEIVRGIKDCKVLMLMCSDASMRSRNVKQEIQVAWKYGRPYLPVLLEQTQFPEQLEYWLEGWQWVDAAASPGEEWLGEVLKALNGCGVRTGGSPETAASAKTPETAAPRVQRIQEGLEGLRAIAKMTDQIWPVASDRVQHRAATRGLGAPQDAVAHAHRLGSRVSLVIETDRDGHLLLLDQGPEGIVYCLCPSWFAPETYLKAGRHHLPQAGAKYESFVVSGRPGREHLLAILSDEPLGLEWITADPKTPARVLNADDVASLLSRLRTLPDDRWTALATYFDIVA